MIDFVHSDLFRNCKGVDIFFIWFSTYSENLKFSAFSAFTFISKCWAQSVQPFDVYWTQTNKRNICIEHYRCLICSVVERFSRLTFIGHKQPTNEIYVLNITDV